MLSQYAVEMQKRKDVASQLYTQVGLRDYRNFAYILDKNFSPYSFTLGLMPFGDKTRNLRIGNVRNIDFFKYSQSNIIDGICEDLKVMNYEYRILDVSFSDKSLKRREFLLKLFICDVSENCKRGDYQIMRFDPAFGEWIFKPSQYEPATFCKQNREIVMIHDEPAGYVRGRLTPGMCEKTYYPFAYIAVRKVSKGKMILKFAHGVWKKIWNNFVG